MITSFHNLFERLGWHQVSRDKKIEMLNWNEITNMQLFLR